MPLTFDSQISRKYTAGRKGGDESGLGDHRVTSKPWQKRQENYNRTKLSVRAVTPTTPPSDCWPLDGLVRELGCSGGLQNEALAGSNNYCRGDLHRGSYV